ncbi:hypothetical protein [Mucilaginibacter phyllosphaerae]|uniref:Uncharacterized protein n=1 Tax=Mucilaginibacter phyllosphaerae TaxID=1812349 RepID=A0A4Y8ABS6_9SPHI|nr:hypothetical protein [Mucilaginibacter phyllosphaerae]MBB3969917.1 hypothetical protein [Mucilaginibacter phyllosphaerae]TEW65291.1 hypothetical protein E2R65_15375 [Mucilaginibacter phyllosphaerae]GGH16812.1 hypothetical protein GCM10007352_26460 [Mucilaginibacter phyllosphaerae]
MTDDNYREIRAQIHNYIIGFTGHVNVNYIAPINKQNDFHEEPKTFLYTVLYKVNNGLSSCQLFLTESKDYERHLDGLFLMLRTLLSDSLITNYVIRKNYTNDSDIVKNILPLYSEHLKFGLYNLRQYGKKFWKYSDIQIGEHVNKFISNYSDYINKNGTLKYKPERTTMGQKADYLITNIPEEAVQQLIIKALSLYTLFSKYEHLGMLSLPLIQRQYDKKNQLTIIREVVEAIAVIGHTIELCIKIWKQFDADIDPIFQSFINKFVTLRETLLRLELNL